MDLLLAGVMLAILYRATDLKRYSMVLRMLPLAALVAMFLIRLLGGAGAFSVAGGTIFSLGIAAFLGAILCGAPEGDRFRSPALRYFGRISYCLYLVHQPVSGLLHGIILDAAPDVGSPAAIAVSLLAVAVSVAIAAASWRWLEQPIVAWAQHPRIGRVLAAA